jgi:Protein of unknown function (DUF3152)
VLALVAVGALFLLRPAGPAPTATRYRSARARPAPVTGTRTASGAASPTLTDQLCHPLRTLSQVSCWNGTRSVLNLRRWLLGDDSYGTDVARYRVDQVSHEVGHGLGYGHRSCPAPGRRAPVMVRQTLSLQVCEAWPHPTGA